MEDKKIGKFDFRVDKGIFIGYSWKNKAYKCYNLRINNIVESINVKYDETDLVKTMKERRNSNIFEEHENEELKKEEEEEEHQQQEEKHPEVEQEENNHNYFQTPSRTPNHWVQKNHPP